MGFPSKLISPVSDFSEDELTLGAKSEARLGKRAYAWDL